jgi:enamine deaminase RidA (YjgF/YER057c/UK114 family)
VTLERVNPPTLPAPSGFSHAVTAHGGSLVFLAGQTALDAEGRIVDGDVVAQFEQALSNLLAALSGAGGGPEHLAKLTIFAVDPQDYRDRAREIGAVWHRLAGRDYPAMALIGIVRLWDEPALVELEGIAVLPE